MILKTAELTGAALDWAVGQCEALRISGVLPGESSGAILGFGDSTYLPSREWRLAGPIIERESIQDRRGNDIYFPMGNESGVLYEPLWLASIADGRTFHGRTMLEAAMRCYVASRYGDSIVVPDDLAKLVLGAV